MDNYNLLLNKIKEFLSKEEIRNEDTNVEVISLYDLYNIINQELKDLRNIMLDSKVGKKVESSRLFATISGKYLCSEIQISENTPRIVFLKKCPDDLTHRWYVEDYLMVYKEKNVDELHLSDERTRENKCFYNFIKRNYNLILETLTKLEDYINLLGEISGKSCTFNTELFNVFLAFNRYGEVSVNLDMLRYNPLYDEYHKNWYKRENIHSYAEKNQDEILKRIPVLPYELEEPFKSIYEKHLEKTKNKEKQLMLK